jgi:CBS domain
MADLGAELDSALTAMGASFHVWLIGTFEPDLLWAPVDAPATRWLAENNPDFDQFPVRMGNATVGVLLRRGEHGEKTVGEAMQPLREGLIVSADMPIQDLIPQLRETHHRLVLRCGNIDGLVTQSDLLKLPVRLVVFALITHLEQVMADVIRNRWPDESWMDLLSEGRRAQVTKKEDDLRRKLMNPPKVELTDFCDKRELCKHVLDIARRSGFVADLVALEELRNQLAHAATFVDQSQPRTNVAAFAGRFERARAWIDELSTLTSRSKAPR